MSTHCSLKPRLTLYTDPTVMTVRKGEHVLWIYKSEDTWSTWGCGLTGSLLTSKRWKAVKKALRYLQDFSRKNST